MHRPAVPRRGSPPWEPWLGTLAAVATGLWITSPAWTGRPIAGDDTMALLVRADRGIALARDLQVDGWAPDFLLGYQQFLFYGPGFSWAVGALRLVTAGLLSTEGALTVLAVAAVVALGPAMVFLARSIGFDRRAAGIAGILALLVDNVFGLGVSGTFGIGLVPHQLAGTAFCLALGSAARTLHDPRRRWVVLLGASLAVLVVTHLFSTVTLAVVLPPALAALAVHRRPAGAAVWRLVAGGLLAAGLSAFWLLPYLAHWGDRGIVPGWTVPSLITRLDEILDGRVLFGPYRGWLVAAGVLWAAVAASRGRRGALVAVAAPVLFLVVGHTLAAAAPRFELSPHLANRGLGYAGLLATLGLALLVADVTALVPRAAAGDALAVAFAIAVVVALPGSPRDDVGSQPEPVAALRDAAAVVARAVPDGARFATERDFPGEIARLGLTHPDFWVSRVARRPTLNVFGLELSPSPAVASVPESVGRLVDEGPGGIAFLADALRGTGTTHLVTVREATATALVGSTAFEPLYRRGAVAVFAVTDPVVGGPRLAPETLVAAAPPGTTARRRHRAPDHQQFALDLPSRGTVELAIGWNTRWRAEDGRGRAVPLHASPAGTVAFDLAAGATTVDLRFGGDPWERAGVAVTLATGLGSAAAVTIAAVRRRRRSTAAP